MSQRLFAAFRNHAHLQDSFNNIYNKLPRDDAFDLVLFVGMLESTHAEGFIDEKEDK
tara:strand:+ start:173 stop:343 length:171 start_codon:yes stop_codon:yes gene_type:complete